MAILNNVEIWFTKLDPKRPSKKMSPLNPTWELQMRTTSKEQKKAWEELNIKVHSVREDPEDEESKISYWRANLKKKSIKKGKNGVPDEPAQPVQVVNGKQEDVDPNSIGNGSRANIRIFQHEYTFEGKKGIASVLMGIQLIKHIIYVPNPMEEFENADTETIVPEDDGDGAPSGAPAGAQAEDLF
jgi:hypothetical protein